MSQIKVTESNCLATTHPHLIKEWHPTKNGDLTPHDVTAGSHKKVWWKCDKGDDHEYYTIIKDKTSGRGCSVCAGKKVVESNCLATVYSHLAKEWHPTKNGNLTSHSIAAHSGKIVWWKCDKGDDHEWPSSILNRAYGNGCAVCSGKKVVKSNCLATTHPHLIKEWHSSKNGNLTPNNVSAGSHKKVWWKCDKGYDHEWEAAISNRTGKNQRGCPICAGQKVVKSNCLATIHPHLVKEWHPIKNADLTPYDVTAGSNKKVWWKCNKSDDHEWKAVIRSRTGKIQNGCAICAGYKVVKSNCLATTHPHLIKEWHPNKNGDLTPYDVTAGSNKKVWWKCDKDNDHIWETVISNRTAKKQRNCPICVGKKVVKSNCLATTHPQLAKQWHPTKNGKLTPYDVVAGSGKKVWWKCYEGNDHEWNASISSRTGKIRSGCAVCAGYKIVKSNCLATTHPHLTKEWHPTKNGDLTPYNVIAGTHKKAWWKCDKGDNHEWEAAISSRTRKIQSGCAVCAGYKVVKSNCLATTHPQLTKQWHPTKNSGLTPYDIIAGSGKKVWWKCDKGDDHEWKASLNDRSRKDNSTGCPICAGKKVVSSNCLATTHPQLTKQWHFNKNKSLSPDNVTAGSNKKIWWICDKDNNHEWKTSVSNRTGKNQRGCPFCVLTPQSKQELIILFELKTIFKNISSKGLKVKLDNKLWTIDIYISQLNLGIEYDGSHWHKEKQEKDIEKTQILMNHSYKMIRIRQTPLEKLFDNDIISAKNFDGKTVVNDLLVKILELFDLNKIIKQKFDSYLEKDSLQNTKSFERYIDKLLTEKVDRKEKNKQLTLKLR